MGHTHKTSKGLNLAFFLNLLFSIIEFIGGYLTQSTAIIADAFHDLMDAVAIGIAVLMDKYAKKPSSQTFSFGYQRFTLVSALILSSILLIGAVLMIQHAILSFSDIKPVNSIGMFALAVLGIAINGFAFFRIKKETESEHLGHSHSKTNKKDANKRAVSLHLLEDVLGWIAVLIGSVIIYFTKWYWVDSLLLFGIAIFIGYNALTNLWDTFKILLQAVPEDISIQEIDAELKLIPNVTDINKLQIWSLDGITNVCSAQIEIQNGSLFTETLAEIKTTLLKNNIHENTIEFIKK